MTFTFSPEFVMTLVINAALIAWAWATMKTQLAGLMERAKDHDGLSSSLTELRVEVRHMKDSLEKQPALIAQVVAATIKETARILTPMTLTSRAP